MLLLVFPHQLHERHAGLSRSPSQVVLVEDSLFFGDPIHPAKFHKQKLWLHRASMKRFEDRVRNLGLNTRYLDYEPGITIVDQLARILQQEDESHVAFADPVDNLLTRRIERACRSLGVDCELLPSGGFINTKSENDEYRGGKNRWFMADFYKWQRKRLHVLMEGDEPSGGKWSFDQDNRKKVPKALLNDLPDLMNLERDNFDREAVEYVEQRFGSNPGDLSELFYPTSHESAQKWLRHFLECRFDRFGNYEDAIVDGQSWLWHSVLTPSLNIGLLTPDQVLKETLDFAERHDVPINSVEGFVRQIIGWREFMRATYEDLGVSMRTTNHWGHERPMPECFYSGTTGIEPIDDTIRRLLQTGYCHHIERLMVLGGFMFLCEIDPDQIYRWFMELFVDSYDWVMVPNVYAMSQNADGGLITTKPYFSGSAYIRKMSNYRKGPWCDIWDALYWRWIWNHVDQLGKNPRWSMMCAMAKKMDEAKLQNHLETAEDFLGKLR